MGVAPAKAPVPVCFLVHPSDLAYAERLDLHLTRLARTGVIDLTGRHRLAPGQEVEAGMADSLSRAQIVLVLLSVDYLQGEPAPDALLGRHRAGAACVIPLHLRACHLGDHPYAALPGLPASGRPVEAYAQKDDAFAEAAAAVERVARQIRAGQRPHLERPTPAASVAADPEGAALFGYMQPGAPELECDRTRQWHDLKGHFTDRGHCAVVLPGAARQGHEYFLLRVQTGLPHDPPREVVRVHFHRRTFPSDERAYAADLAVSLGCPEARLVAELRRRLARGNLVLLHDALDRPVPADRLAHCLGRWLPALVREVTRASAVPGYIKCLQPVVWVRDGWLRALWTALRGQAGGRRRPLTRWAARAVVRAATRAPADVLPVEELDPLDDILQSHVEDFVKRLGLPREQRAAFVTDVMSGDASSEEILRLIVKHFPHYRQHLPGAPPEGPGAAGASDDGGGSR